jgi:hypothetical protein
MRHSHAQALPSQTPAMGAGHVRLGPSLVDEDQPFRIEIGLGIEPGPALSQDVWSVLFARMASLFLRVIL